MSDIRRLARQAKRNGLSLEKLLKGMKPSLVAAATDEYNKYQPRKKAA